MASITTQERSNILKLVVGMFNAAPGAAYLNEFVGAYQAMGNSYVNLATALGNNGAFQQLYPNSLTNGEKATKFLSTLGLDKNQEAQEWVQAKLNAGENFGVVILQALEAILETKSPDFADAQNLLNNKAAVAEYYSVSKGQSSEDLGVLQGAVANVKADSDVSTPAAMDKLIGGGNTGAGGVSLTLGQDTIVSTSAGTTFVAGLAQAPFLGNVTNTFESGDSITATGEGNTLKVDLTHTVSGSLPVGPAISAATKNIQVVEFREQAQQFDTGGNHMNHVNGSVIDAERMLGVKEWWTVNSRSDIQIEDVRSRPEDTTIGMRDTDPEVGFFVYFDPEQIKGGEDVKTALTLSLSRPSAPGAELGDTSIEGVSFKLGGVEYVLTSPAIAAAKTYVAWRDALEAAAKTVKGLEGLSFVLNKDNSVTLIDAAGGEFQKGSWKFVGNNVPADGDLVWKQTIGVPERTEKLVETNIHLDNVGRTSQGGALDVGSLGDGGVQKFNVEVERSSWLTSMKSTEHLVNNAPGNGPVREYLEEVYLVNKGTTANNLTVGTAVFVNDVRHPDNRVSTDGLTNVRIVDGSAFKGELNLGIQLDANALGRYLNQANEPVEFNYTTGVKNDTVNLFVDGAVAEDPDFIMNVNTGAGDDRLILEVTTDAAARPDLASTSIDGGTGTNTLVVRSDVGMNAGNTFKSFKNFQNYEVEGAGSSHNFTNLNGVKTVVVATDAGTSNTLVDLPSDLASISLSGKNQNIGNANNADQTFATLDIKAAKAKVLTLNLDNTARVDGVLSLANLNIGHNTATDLSAVEQLNIVSNGKRLTSNDIGSIKAETVGKFVLSGSQDLNIDIDAAAKSTSQPGGRIGLTVDGKAATGDLDVTIAAAIPTTLNANTASKNVTIDGGKGTEDRLTFTTGLVTNALTKIAAFETVAFEGTATFNAANTSGVNLYESQTGSKVLLTNLRGVESVEIGGGTEANGFDPINNGADQGFVTSNVSSSSTLNLDVATAAAAAQKLQTDGFTTLNVNLTKNVNLMANEKDYTFDLSEQSYDSVTGAWVAGTDASNIAAGAPIPANHISRIELTNLNLTGGTGEVQAGVAVSRADLGTLISTLKLVDVSGYTGHVTATLSPREKATVATTQYDTGNTVVKVGSFGIDFTVDHSAEKVVTFEFTKEAQINAAAAGNDDFQWKIDGFTGINDATPPGAVAGAGNVTVLDVSALGVRTLADLKMEDQGGDLHITANSGNHTYEIVLAGTVQADLGLENFKFSN